MTETRPVRPLSDPSLWLALAFVVVAVVSRLVLPYSSSEAEQVEFGMDLFGRVPLDALFAQRARPVLALFYFPFRSLHPEGFFLAHILLAGLAVYLAGRTARLLGSNGPVASIVVASSFCFFVMAAAGPANADGVVVLVLLFYLYARGDRPFAAGVVASLLPFVRQEGTLFVLALTVHAVVYTRHRWRFVAGLLALTLPYLVAGALYHHDILWLYDFRPNQVLPFADKDLGRLVGSHTGLSATHHALRMLAESVPFWPLVLLWYPRCRSREERLFFWALVLTLLAMLVTPILGIAYYGMLSRYGVIWLPGVALAAARFASRDEEAVPSWTVALVFFALGVLQTVLSWRGLSSLHTAVVFSLPLAFRAAQRARSPQLRGARARTLAMAAAGLGALLLPGNLDSHQAEFLSPKLLRAGDWVAAQETPPTVVYTNVHGLSDLLRRHSLPHTPRFLVRADIGISLFHELNHENGQYAAIISSIEPLFLDGAAWLCKLASERDFTGSLWFWETKLEMDTDNFRYPAAFAECASVEVARFESISIRAGRKMGEGCPPPPPPTFTEEAMTWPCRPETAR